MVVIQKTLNIINDFHKIDWDVDIPKRRHVVNAHAQHASRVSDNVETPS